jgi:hypothetical protein
MARNKYGAKKTTVNGIVFDSKAEAARYCQLAKDVKDGLIHNLVIKPKFKFACGIKYTPDFSYNLSSNNALWLEDVKGCVTRDFKMRLKLLKHEFGLDVVVIKMKPSEVNKWLGIGA